MDVTGLEHVLAGIVGGDFAPPPAPLTGTTVLSPASTPLPVAYHSGAASSLVLLDLSGNNMDSRSLEMLAYAMAAAPTLHDIVLERNGLVDDTFYRTFLVLLARQMRTARHRRVPQLVLDVAHNKIGPSCHIQLSRKLFL